MNEHDRQALMDYFTCAGLEAVESLREALQNLRDTLDEEE